jgi:hypothetical protein
MVAQIGEKFEELYLSKNNHHGKMKVCSEIGGRDIVDYLIRGALIEW